MVFHVLLITFSFYVCCHAKKRKKYFGQNGTAWEPINVRTNPLEKSAINVDGVKIHFSKSTSHYVSSTFCQQTTLVNTGIWKYEP